MVSGHQIYGVQIFPHGMTLSTVVSVLWSFQQRSERARFISTWEPPGRLPSLKNLFSRSPFCQVVNRGHQQQTTKYSSENKLWHQSRFRYSAYSAVALQPDQLSRTATYPIYRTLFARWHPLLSYLERIIRDFTLIL